MSFLVDTDYLIDTLGGIPRAKAVLTRLSREGLFISIVSVGEIFEGAFRRPNPEARLATYRAFLSGYAVLPLAASIMERFGENRAHLRATGRMIPDLDLLIAATALDHDLTLVTRNRRHFARVPGLRLFLDEG